MSGPASRSKRRQKWSNMADFNKRRRWRGPALGGRLQRAGLAAPLLRAASQQPRRRAAT